MTTDMFVQPMFRSADRAISDDARVLQRGLSAVWTHFRDSFSLGASYEATLEELNELYEESQASDWKDSYADRIEYATYVEARRFLSLLPTTFPIPEVGRHPEGEITFEWYRGPNRVYSVAIDPTGKLHYAGMYEADTEYGTEFFGEDLPSSVAKGLRRLFSL